VTAASPAQRAYSLGYRRDIRKAQRDLRDMADELANLQADVGDIAYDLDRLKAVQEACDVEARVGALPIRSAAKAGNPRFLKLVAEGTRRYDLR
jgi:hypothetical protein